MATWLPAVGTAAAAMEGHTPKLASFSPALAGLFRHAAPRDPQAGRSTCQAEAATIRLELDRLVCVFLVWCSASSLYPVLPNRSSLLKPRA